jgi:hypothetical protein
MKPLRNLDGHWAWRGPGARYLCFCNRSTVMSARFGVSFAKEGGTGRLPEQSIHPVCSWWWAGVPAGPVHAAVLGEPYRPLWPSFCEKAETIGELSFISTGDWLSNADGFRQINSPYIRDRAVEGRSWISRYPARISKELALRRTAN